MRVVSSQWVVPGRSLSGANGWLLKLPGFAVDVLAPPAHVRQPAGTTAVELRANVVMMCGCPIEPGGLWDASRYEVKALVSRDGQSVDRVDLAYAGSISQFAGSVPVAGAGAYEVTVNAYDPLTGNTGVDRTTFLVAK